jgi:hypothetical protein
VLVLGEDRVVELNAVLVEELLGDNRGDVQQGVAHAEEHAREAAGFEGRSLRGRSVVRGSRDRDEDDDEGQRNVEERRDRGLGRGARRPRTIAIDEKCRESAASS